MRDLQERKLLKVGKFFCWTKLRKNTRTVRTERCVGEAATKKIEDLRRNLCGVCLFAKHEKKRAASVSTASSHALTTHVHDSYPLPLPLLSFFLHFFACAPFAQPVLYLFLPMHEKYQFCYFCSYCDFLAQLKTWYEIDSTLSRCSPSLCAPIDPLPRCQYSHPHPPIQYSPKPMYRFICQPQIFPAVDPEARLADLRCASATYCVSSCFSLPVPIRLDSSHTPDESATEAGFSASKRRNLKPARRGSHGILFI
jgi:hypothetical protein